MPLLALVCPCGSVLAQMRHPETISLPRVFIGAGGAAATNDAKSRMRLVSDGSLFVWLVEGGAALSRRVGVGVEFVQSSAVSGATRGITWRASGRQEERVLLGLLRFRALASERFGLDIVGGAGVLFQHHEKWFEDCFLGSCGDTLETLHRRAPALVVGAEVPIRLGRHFWVAGLARCYALRRGDHVAEQHPRELIPWQYEWKSSTRVAFGISARAGW